MSNSGTAEAQADIAQDVPMNSVVILSFGNPTVNSGCTTYGATGFFPTRPLTPAQIEAAIVSYAEAYAAAIQGFLYPLNLTIVVGTNNAGFANIVARCGANAPYYHAQQWQDIIQAINTSLSENGISSNVVVSAGIDAEIAWSPITPVDYWLNGFDAINAGDAVYDFGDAAGCPKAGNGKTNGTCKVNNKPSWTQLDVLYISSLSPGSMPLPEIYSVSSTGSPNGGNAMEWEQIALYGYESQGYTMAFPGPLSQYGACQTKKCPGTDNTPSEAWTDLYNELNGDAVTSQFPYWSTDITLPGNPP
jgi:hypothetical protein